ncbi:ABC transporter ATP-binding protein [Clostridiaceae bacterium M8S5]|nr:ABC transporter ATP-binding protein [Clostridiaceae bacterium M8S5]
MKSNSFISNKEKLYIFIKFLVTSISTLLSFLIPIVIKNIIDHKESGFDRKQLLLYAIIYIVVYIVKTLLGIIITRQKFMLLQSLQKQVFRKIMVLKTKRIGNTSSGQLIEVIDKDVNNASTYYFEAYPDIILSVINFLGSIIIIFYLDILITIVIIVALLLLAVIIVPMYIYLAKFTEKEYENHKGFIVFLNNIIKSLPLIKASGTEDVEIDMANIHFDKSFKNTIKSLSMEKFVTPIIASTFIIIIGGIVVFISFRISMGLITIGELTAYILYALKGIVPLLLIIFKSKELVVARNSIKRIKDILSYEEEDLYSGKNLKYVDNIRFDNVSFRYTNEDILKNICLRINKGEYIAIVGASGTGKTTLISLIERFFDPTEGSILVNNEDYQSYTLSSLRKNISYVSQDYIIMNKSIRNNITYGLSENLSDDEILSRLKGIQCFDFILKLENKLDFVVSENAMNLSGGQKQRLAIARAYLRNSDIWLLDEATANLDSHAEKDIASVLSIIKNNKVIISIAHRLSSIINADRIIVIEDGKITGDGEHNTLLKTHDYYRKLVENQFINKE